MATTQERLDKVRDAIDAIIDGGAVKEYEISGRRLERMKLSELRELEHDLMGRLSSENGSKNYASFESPS